MNGVPATLNNPDQVIFVVALLENDDGDPEALRGIVKGIVGGSVLGSLTLDRRHKVAALIRDVNSALGTPTGAPNFDDKVGDPQELRFSLEELMQAESGQVVSKTLVFAGDGGRYSLTFQGVQSHNVFGAIREKWIGMGSEQSSLGLPLGPELPTFDGIGRTQSFQGGIISWHPDTGADTVWGLIGERWLQIGREQFGYPITDETSTFDGHGRFNHFRAVHLPEKPEASIYWSPESGVHEIFGAIRTKWAEMGWERSHLGYPVSAEEVYAGGRIQRFQGGALLWTPEAGVFVQ